MGTINGRVVTGSGRLNGGAFTLTVTATGTAALLGTANTFTALNTFQAQISSPDTGHANSERFGSGAIVGGSHATAIGNGAQATQAQATAIGASAVASGSNSTAVGHNASAGGAHVTVGQGATGAGGSGASIGNGATAAGSNGISIGRIAAAAHANAIVIGRGATSTAVNQLVIGSSTQQIDNAYLGSGVTAASPTGIVINATGGSGTDIAGASITIAGGRGTGTGAPGRIVFQQAPAGSTGTSLNTLRDRWSIETGGNLAIWQQTDSQTRQVGSITPTFPTAADGTRKGRVVHTVYDTAEREGFRIEADGAAPMIGFLGAAAIARPASYTLAGTPTRTLPTIPGDYTGIDNAQGGTVYAAVADLNALKALVASLEGVVNQALVDLAATSGYGLLAAA